jgi:hypothetical protein
MKKFRYEKPDGIVITLDKQLDESEILRRGYVPFVEAKKKNCGHCKWWVNENPKKIGDYDHKFAMEQNKGFCLIQDLFTYMNPKQKACEDACLI